MSERTFNQNGDETFDLHSPSHPWGLFVLLDDKYWASNFFFKTKKAAEWHGRQYFKVYLVGKANV